MKNKESLIIFIIAIIIVSVLRMLLVYGMPIVANVELGIDDMLMIDITDNLIQGNWVGNYSDVVISKGLTFPLLLAVCYLLKVDYITMMTVLYIIACLILTYVISKKIKNKLVLFVFYTTTLFVPIMYTYQVMQRVYRNAIVPSFAIMIIAGYLYMFFSRNEKGFKKKIFAAIGTGIALALFWYTREDSIWMLPFIIFMSFALIVSVIFKNKRINKEFFKVLLILIIPIAITFAYRNVLCYQNYKHFGVYTVYNNEEYNKAMKSLKKVKKYHYYDNIDFTMEKLRRVSEVTCLGTIYPRLAELVYGYSLIDSTPLDGEVANGWFPWAIKGALSEAGYYKKAENINAFSKTLHMEIEAALANGTLEKEDVKSDKITSVKKVLKSTIDVFKALQSYYDIAFEDRKLEYKEGYEKYYQRYAKYTGNKFLLINPETQEDVYHFDNMENYAETTVARVNIINKLFDIYKIISNIMLALGGCLYVIYSLIIFIELIKKKFNNLEMWVAISGILGAMLTLIFGIAYETAFNANVITAMYLSGVYPLMIIFGIVMIYESINITIKYIKNKKQKKLVDKIEIKEEINNS